MKLWPNIKTKIVTKLKKKLIVAKNQKLKLWQNFNYDKRVFKKEHFDTLTTNVLWAAVLLRTTASFMKDQPVCFVGKRSNWTTIWDFWRNWTTMWRRKKNTNCWSLVISGVKSVSRHQEASAGGGSIAPQGGLIAQQILAICVSRTTCLAIGTNFPSRWLYQDHRCSLIKELVVLIKWICSPT